jgi:hypothetical protein
LRENLCMESVSYGAVESPITKREGVGKW